MPTDLQNLQTRRTAIYTELAALDSTKPGGKPNISGGGGGIVDHVGYKDGLYRELELIDKRISQSEGPWELSVQGHSQ
jgi:hypothetical protein